MVFLHSLHLLDLINNFVLLFWMGGAIVYLLTPAVGRGFGVDVISNCMPPCNSSSLHVRDGGKGLLRGILSGGVWNGFLRKGPRRKRSCGSIDGDGHLFFGITLILLLPI